MTEICLLEVVFSTFLSRDHRADPAKSGLGSLPRPHCSSYKHRFACLYLNFTWRGRRGDKAGQGLILAALQPLSSPHLHPVMKHTRSSLSPSLKQKLKDLHRASKKVLGVCSGCFQLLSDNNKCFCPSPRERWLRTTLTHRTSYTLQRGEHPSASTRDKVGRTTFLVVRNDPVLLFLLFFLQSLRSTAKSPQLWLRTDLLTPTPFSCAIPAYFPVPPLG